MDPVQITFDSQYAIVVSRKQESNSDSVSTNPTRVNIEVKGLNMEGRELDIQQRPFVGGLQTWIAGVEGDRVVLALNMNQENPKTSYATLRISLRDDASIYNDLQAYFLKYNQIYKGKYVYIPVPGDDLKLIRDENADGIPDTTGEVTIGAKKYGYTNVTVNDVIYHYYVDKENALTNIDWYVRIGNELTKYVYNNQNKMYEKNESDGSTTP